MLKLATSKLGHDNYVRPKQTYTDKLTTEEIEAKLEDYTKVEDLYKIPIGVHIRYFTKKNGSTLFRLGGMLTKADGLPDYIILNNGSKSWSVQTKDTTFFRKMSPKEIKSIYQQKIDQLTNEVKKLKEENLKLINQNNKYYNNLKNY